MKNLIKSAIAALSFAGLAACGGGGADAELAKMGKLTDKLCACKEMKCAEGVMKEMSSMKESKSKPSKAQMDKAMKLATRMAECQQKLMAADMPPPAPMPPPPAPTPTPPPAADPAMAPAPTHPPGHTPPAPATP